MGECTFYEYTNYEETFSFSGWYCNKKVHTMERTVVNMCIQGDTNTPSWYTYAYVCGGYDWRSGNTHPYTDNQVWHSTADCSDDRYAGFPTSAPTEATFAPTVNPTQEGESPFSSLWCSESTCAGVDSPRADETSIPEEPLPEPTEPSEGTDIIFLFDLSSGVSFDNVESQIEFVRTITDCVSTYAEVRVSAMTYGDKVKKLFGLGDEISFDMTEDDLVGGEPFADEALAAALEELIINGRDTNIQAVVLMSFNAPMTGHEACLGDYVSPPLDNLREMGVSVMNIGINLDVATMENLQCMVPAGMEDNAEDYLVNTDSLDTLAEEMGYTDCDGGEVENTKLEEPSTTPGAEIVYLFDSSYGASFDNFKDQIEFAKTMANCAAAYDHGEYRMSAMTYGDIVKKLFGLNDEVDFDMISEDDMVGGDPFVDEALAVAFEELSVNGKDGNFKAVALFSYSAPMKGYEPCLGDYVSPQLEELRKMDIQVMNIGINLDAATMQSLQCMVPAGMEDVAEDYLVNTDSLANLAEEFCTEDDEYYTGESE